MNSFQQPVDAEPSVGTLHLLPAADSTSCMVVAGVDPSTAAWSAAVDLSTLIPIGAKAIVVGFLLTGSNTVAGGMAFTVALSDVTSIAPAYNKQTGAYCELYHDDAAAGNAARSSGEVTVRITASRSFYYRAIGKSNVSTPEFYVFLRGYYL